MTLKEDSGNYLVDTFQVAKMCAIHARESLSCRNIVLLIVTRKLDQKERSILLLREFRPEESNFSYMLWTVYEILLYARSEAHVYHEVNNDDLIVKPRMCVQCVKCYEKHSLPLRSSSEEAVHLTWFLTTCGYTIIRHVRVHYCLVWGTVLPSAITYGRVISQYDFVEAI